MSRRALLSKMATEVTLGRSWAFLGWVVRGTFWCWCQVKRFGGVGWRVLVVVPGGAVRWWCQVAPWCWVALFGGGAGWRVFVVVLGGAFWWWCRVALFGGGAGWRVLVVQILGFC